MRRFIVCCLIAGWLGSCPQLLSPATAQVPPVTPTCSIIGSGAGQMFANAALASRLESNSSDSYFRVECTGAITGKLRLSLGAGSKLYNGSARFRLVGVSGIFTTTTSDYTDSPMLIPYANLSGIAAGEVRYQVQVIAANGYLLPGASDYAVKMQAELVQ
jgi:hypothetical protein